MRPISIWTSPLSGLPPDKSALRRGELREIPARTSPFGGFEAVYTAIGDPVPGLTAANVGEQLTGVGKEVYLRSAFVGQGGAAISTSKELEARISALATSGQEDVPYSAVERTLREWRNRQPSQCRTRPWCWTTPWPPLTTGGAPWPWSF